MFMQQSCVRNDHSCINWGVVSTAASYNKGIRNPNSISTTYFGTSTTLKTKLQKIQKYIHQILMSTSKIYYVIKNVSSVGLTIIREGFPKRIRDLAVPMILFLSVGEPFMNMFLRFRPN